MLRVTITPNNIYETHGETIQTLERIRRHLGFVAKGRFARMLGMMDARLLRGWYAGRSRPSQRYLVRLFHIYFLFEDGLLDPLTFDGIEYWRQKERISG